MNGFYFNYFYTHGKAICFSMVFLFCGHAFAQQTTAGKIWYGVKYIGMNVDTSKVTDERFKDEVVQEDRNAKRFLKGDRSLYILTFQGEDSWFKPISQMNMDGENDPMSFYTDIFETLKKNTSFYSPTPERTKGHQYYVSVYKKQVLNGEYDWKLTDEYKTILEHNCQKAKCIKKWNGRPVKITAWFTEKIPVPDGPGRFAGLPGMILAVQYSGRYYYAKKIKLKDSVDLDFPPKERLLTFKEYMHKDIPDDGN